MLALDLGDRVEVRLVGRAHLGLLVGVEPAHAGPVGELALVALDRRHRVEQLDPRRQPRLQQHVVQRALGVLERQAELVVLVALVERAHLLEVGARVRPDHLPDRLVRERLGEAEQREARGHPLEVPGEVPEVGLVEVVDVEDEDPGGVHVGAVVLRVQVALDPDAARALVGPAVLEAGDVGVEQARAAAVERERVGGHLAELAPERLRVGLDQVLEGVDEHVHDLLLARVAVAAQVLERDRISTCAAAIGSAHAEFELAVLEEFGAPLGRAGRRARRAGPGRGARAPARLRRLPHRPLHRVGRRPVRLRAVPCSATRARASSSRSARA